MSAVKQGPEASKIHNKLDAVIITFSVFWKKTLPSEDVKTIFYPQIYLLDG